MTTTAPSPTSTEAIRLNPKYASAFANRGAAWYDKADYDRAIADCSEAIRLTPQYAWAFNIRGLAAQGNGDLDQAIADFTEAVRIEPKYAWAFYNRAEVFAGKGDLDRAIADYTSAIRITAVSDFYNGRGNAWRQKGDLDLAITDFSEAIRVEPKEFAGYSNRGYAYFYKGDFAAAAADLLRANDTADNAYSMLWRYLARGRLGQDGAGELGVNAARLTSKRWPYPVIDFYLGRHSMEELSSAATAPNERCEAEFYTGEWHLLKNDQASAKAALQRAADICPKSYIEFAGAAADLKRLGP